MRRADMQYQHDAMKEYSHVILPENVSMENRKVVGGEEEEIKMEV